jgi:hypothetical protein
LTALVAFLTPALTAYSVLRTADLVVLLTALAARAIVPWLLFFFVAIAEFLS